MYRCVMCCYEFEVCNELDCYVENTRNALICPELNCIEFEKCLDLSRNDLNPRNGVGCSVMN